MLRTSHRIGRKEPSKPAKETQPQERTTPNPPSKAVSRNELALSDQKTIILDGSQATSGVLGSIWTNKMVLMEWSVPFLFVFGGCCSNMFALESIVKYEANSGLAITLIQILFTASVTAVPQIRVSTHWPWVLRRPKLPFHALLSSAAFFWIVNMMNNWAFRFKISVPVHIILRSGGSVTSMAAGFLHGRKYSKGQVLGVCFLTAGVIIAAFADAASKGKSSIETQGDTAEFMNGLLVLLFAQLLSAEMGIYTESMYRTYGRYWEDNLLWSHLLSTFFFLTVTPEVRSQLDKLWNSGSHDFKVTTYFLTDFNFRLPKQIVFLSINAVTQFFCIQGVSRLAARLSPLTVTVILNIRKLVSLILSIWVFGNYLPIGVWAGAVLVFAGGMVYAGWDLNSRKLEFKGKSQ